MSSSWMNNRLQFHFFTCGFLFVGLNKGFPTASSFDSCRLPIDRTTCAYWRNDGHLFLRTDWNGTRNERNIWVNVSRSCKQCITYMFHFLVVLAYHEKIDIARSTVVTSTMCHINFFFFLQGRAMSRAKSRRNLDFQEVLNKLQESGISIRVASPKLVMEEAPESYKNVTDVVDTCHAAGISKKCFQLRPIAVIKG